MRRANNQPWMGRTVVTGIAVFVVLGAVGGSAQAQNTPIVIDNVEAWWDHLNCERMINAVNAIDGLNAAHPVLDNGGNAEEFSPGTDGDNDSEREWCAMWNGLGANQQRALNAGAKQSRADGGIITKASDRVFDMHGWWNGMSDEGRLIAIGGVAADVPAGANGELDQLTVAVSERATAAYHALMSSMTTEEEAPALPLAGVGILGLLVAGRGAWLRRRA